MTTTSSTETTPGAPTGRPRSEGPWWLVLGYGVVTVLVGLLLVLWPDRTLTVLAVIVGVELLLTGMFRVVLAVTAPAFDVGMRALTAFSGMLALLAGLLCLRAPLQTLVFVGLLVGIWLVVNGFIDVFSAVVSRGSTDRVWDLAKGVLSVAAGCYLMLDPTVPLSALVVIMSAWLFGYGFITVVAALRLRRGSR
jgi:uncharacterized membrane protein HdeD (DUF308 family)